MKTADIYYKLNSYQVVFHFDDGTEAKITHNLSEKDTYNPYRIGKD